MSVFIFCDKTYLQKPHCVMIENISSNNIVQTPPYSIIKGGIDFLKFGNKRGDEIFFLEREGLD